MESFHRVGMPLVSLHLSTCQMRLVGGRKEAVGEEGEGGIWEALPQADPSP